MYEKDDVELIVLVLDGRGMVFSTNWPRANVWATRIRVLAPS